jgi:hypothetical protein
MVVGHASTEELFQVVATPAPRPSSSARNGKSEMEILISNSTTLAAARRIIPQPPTSITCRFPGRFLGIPGSLAYSGCIIPFSDLLPTSMIPLCWEYSVELLEQALFLYIELMCQLNGFPGYRLYPLLIRLDWNAYQKCQLSHRAEAVDSEESKASCEIVIVLLSVLRRERRLAFHPEKLSYSSEEKHLAIGELSEAMEFGPWSSSPRPLCLFWH